MDETPGHAADEPDEEPDPGALPPPAGDRTTELTDSLRRAVESDEPIQVDPGAARPLHEATEAFLDDVIEHLTGGNPTEPIHDPAGNLVGIRIHPGRPDDYDTYLQRPRSQWHQTYDDWAKLQRDAIPASSSEPADVAIGGEPPAWPDTALGAVLRRFLQAPHRYTAVNHFPAHEPTGQARSFLTVDGSIQISTAEAALIDAILHP